MKTLSIIFLFGAFLVSSCRKERTCSCHYNYSGTGIVLPQPYKIRVTTTKRNAPERCAQSNTQQGTQGIDYLARVCVYDGN
jgi:hypothetical protein